MAEIMDKMSDEMGDNNKLSGFVFRVLSGPINGIEFSLGAYAYFMCVGDAAESQGSLGQNLEYAERTLYLPSTVPGNNFIVDLAENVFDDKFSVSVSHPEHQETLNFALNTVCYVEGIYFALKREGDQWSDEVLKGALPSINQSQVNEVVAVKQKKSAGKRYKWLVLAIFLLAVFVGGSAAWIKYAAVPAPESSASIVQQIVGTNAGFLAQRGRDDIVYLFAPNSQQAEWARQSIARTRSTENWKVVTPQEEEIRLARILERHNVAFFTIRFNDLRAPILVMSSTRNSTEPADLEKVKDLLLEIMPYAKNLVIELKDDKEVLHVAEQGLGALGFDYQIMQSDSGVTLSSFMSAGDSRMAEFNRFVSQFYRTWGRRYIHFSVELQDDSLKGKSFKYGQDGYVNMGKSHWMFENQK